LKKPSFINEVFDYSLSQNLFQLNMKLKTTNSLWNF
jgi:hypothetical protein